MSTFDAIAFHYIAGDFSKFDAYAIKQMNWTIELIRYVKFGDDLLLLEQINAVVAPPIPVDDAPGPPSGPVKASKYSTVIVYAPGQGRCGPEGPVRGYT